MSNPDPIKVDPKRKSDYEDMMLRLGVKNKLKAAVESGHSFEAACELVGIPYEYAFSASQTDDEFREIWKISNKIFETKNITQTAIGDKRGWWTTVVSAAVFVI